VVRTRVGYCGGSTAHPTYYDLADHTEALQIDFDPQVVSYEAMARRFFAEHDPSRPRNWSRQYMTALFCIGDAERHRAQAVKAQVEAERQKPVLTPLVAIERFWPAEDYHQKYYLRSYRDLVAELRGYDDVTLRESTAAARMNGYVSDHGTRAQLEEDLPRLGLSPSGETLLCRAHKER
jgi:methionine-S-sulfoxide reductase